MFEIAKTPKDEFFFARRALMFKTHDQCNDFETCQMAGLMNSNGGHPTDIANGIRRVFTKHFLDSKLLRFVGRLKSLISLRVTTEREIPSANFFFVAFEIFLIKK